MPACEQVFVANSRWYRLLARGPASISLSTGKVRFESKSGKILAEIPVSFIDNVSTSRFLLWTRITIRTARWNRYSIGGLRKRSALGIHDAIHETAARNVHGLGQKLKHVDCQRQTLFCRNRYLRHSTASKFFDQHRDVVRDIRGLCRLEREKLKAVAQKEYDRFVPFTSVKTLECERKRSNERFVTSSVPKVRAAASIAELDMLTDEQAEAIATDEDTTLVLAGAGTGKTSVIVGKLAHLVQNQHVDTKEILVLAYNRKAAAEIRDRLPHILAGVEISTFHSFGLKVLPMNPDISPLAEDDKKLKSTIDRFLDDLLEDRDQSEALINFVLYNRAPWRPVYDFETISDYNEYIRSVELRTLHGEKVRSFEELTIANYLSEHCVNYLYEAPYPTNTATPQRRQYCPDFYLTDHDIYIEHFALDRKGNPPQGWVDYADGVEWKRDVHKRYGTALVETFSWQHENNTLLPTLRLKLEEHGVSFARIPREELIRLLREQKMSWLSSLLNSFLNHVKTSNFSLDELHRNAQTSSDRIRSIRFLNVFELVDARYEKVLAEQNTIDFHDMINDAEQFIREIAWESPYRYVLVDEFQDIAAGRMRLLQALNRPNVAYFLVGDDWQSIYRFAGSDVGLFKQCEKHLSYKQQQTLSHTFRYGDGILDPATTFIRRNPEQTQRPLRSKRSGADSGLTVVFNGDRDKGAILALQEIASETAGERANVLVLGRFNFNRNVLKALPECEWLHLEFSTVHRAKGREADYVILLDLKDDQYGFPCRIEDDPLLELVLPPETGEAFPFAEERRLFYVALTRARIGAWLITDKYNPSRFVTELLEKSDGLRIIDQPVVLDCPRCETGNLVPSMSQQNLRCTRYPTCRFLAPLCPHCGTGYVIVAKSSAKCTNTNCLGHFTVCPACGLGIMLEKNGRNGRFWGCSTWTPDEPQCNYTRNFEGFMPNNDIPL